MKDLPQCPVKDCATEITPEIGFRSQRETYTVGQAYTCGRGHELLAILDGPEPESRLDFVPVWDRDL